MLVYSWRYFSHSLLSQIIRYHFYFSLFVTYVHKRLGIEKKLEVYKPKYKSDVFFLLGYGIVGDIYFPFLFMCIYIIFYIYVHYLRCLCILLEQEYVL